VRTKTACNLFRCINTSKLRIREEA